MYPSFFKNLGPIKVETIVKNLNCINHNVEDDFSFLELTNIENLSKNNLSFLTDKNFSRHANYHSGTILCSNATYKKFIGKNSLIVVKDVYESVAKLSNIFYRNLFPGEIKLLEAPKINNYSSIGKNVVVENGSVIGSNVNIGSGCFIGYNCIIGDNVTIGNNTVITNSIIAENVSIGNNASIGQQGFGFALKKNNNIKIFHKGRVIIQAGVYLGSNCTVDRGSFDDTVIGENTYFDNLCHISHNVVIGNNCVFAAMSGIAGSTIIGNNVMAGGQIGIAGHLIIGNNVSIAAQSGVVNNLSDNSNVMGYPAINKFTFIKKYKKNYA